MALSQSSPLQAYALNHAVQAENPAGLVYTVTYFQKCPARPPPDKQQGLFLEFMQLVRSSKSSATWDRYLFPQKPSRWCHEMLEGDPALLKGATQMEMGDKLPPSSPKGNDIGGCNTVQWKKIPGTCIYFSYFCFSSLNFLLKTKSDRKIDTFAKWPFTLGDSIPLLQLLGGEDRLVCMAQHSCQSKKTSQFVRGQCGSLQTLCCICTRDFATNTKLYTLFQWPILHNSTQHRTTTPDSFLWGCSDPGEVGCSSWHWVILNLFLLAQKHAEREREATCCPHSEWAENNPPFSLDGSLWFQCHFHSGRKSSWGAKAAVAAQLSSKIISIKQQGSLQSPGKMLPPPQWTKRDCFPPPSLGK